MSRAQICVRNKCCSGEQTGKHLCRQQCVRNSVSSFAKAYKLQNSCFFFPIRKARGAGSVIFAYEARKPHLLYPDLFVRILTASLAFAKNASILQNFLGRGEGTCPQSPLVEQAPIFATEQLLTAQNPSLNLDSPHTKNAFYCQGNESVKLIIPV